jgi:hypothetical protein
VFGDKPGFKYVTYDDAGAEQRGEMNWVSANVDERLQQATEFYRNQRASPEGEALRVAKDLFYRLSTGATTTAEEQELALKMFPQFDAEAGHQVLQYSAEAFGQLGNGLFDAAFNTGNLVVHVDADGNPLGIQAVTKQTLGERKGSGNLLAGLYYKASDGFVKRTLGKLLAGATEKVRLSNSAEQLQKMQALLLAMHFNDKGVPVGHVGVTNLKDLSRIGTNAASTVIPVAELAALKAVRQEASIRAQLQASGVGGQRLLAVLDNDALYTDGVRGYVTDPIQGLLNNHKAASPEAHELIRQSLGDYETAKDEASLGALLRAIRTERNRLGDTLSREEAGQNTWYVQLGLAEMQLLGIDPYLNPHKALGDLDKNFIDFNNNPNPAVKYLVAQRRAMLAKFTQRFVPKAQARTARIEALRKAYEGLPASQRGKLTGGALRENDQPMYGRLQQKSEAWQVSEDGKTYTKVSIPNGRWVMPGSAAFAQLLPAEQRFIAEEVAESRQHLVDWHRASHRDLQTGELGEVSEAEAWYEKQWGEGQIPFSPAGASTQRLQGGNWLESYQTSFERLLSDNPNFDNADTGARENLGQYYQGQGGNGSVWGGEQKRQMLGIERTDDVHPDTGEPLKFIVKPNWKQVQARFDQDLGRSQALFAAEMLRHELSQDASRLWKVATAVLNHQEEAQGIVRKYIERTDTDPNSGQYQDKEARSTADKYLEAMYKYIFLGDSKQGGGSEGVQKLIKVGAVGTAVVRGVLMKGDVLRPIRNTVALLVGNLAPMLATFNDNGATILDPKLLKDAGTVVLNPKNRDMIYQLAVHLGVSDASELALTRSRELTGRGYTAEDVWNVDMEIDRAADEAIAHTLMVLHLMTNKSWAAYGWDEKTKQFTYDEKKDRAARGEKTVDAVRAMQVASGELEPGEKMHTGYDHLMKSALESAITSVRGNYSPLSNTQLGTNVLGSQLLPMRRWFLEKVKSGTIDNHTSTTKGDWVDGKWVGQRDEGQWQSLTGFLAHIHKSGYNPMTFAEQWKKMDATSRQNVALFSTKLAAVTALTLAAALLHGLWDDDNEKDAEKKRLKQRGIVDSVVQEASVMANLQFLTDAAASPFLVAAFFKQSATTVGNYLAGDIKAGNRGAVARVGGLKAGKRIADFLNLTASGDDK